MQIRQCSSDINLAFHSPPSASSRYRDRVHAQDVVGVAGKQRLAVRAPRQGNTLWLAGVFADVGEVGLELVDNGLALEVKDLDARCRRRTEPVPVRREDEGVDDVARLEGVEVLALVEVPEHSDTVLASGRAERPVRGNSDGCDVAGVAKVVMIRESLLEFFLSLERDRKE